MAKSAGNAVSKGIVWVILLLLIIGLAGFGVGGFGGSVRSIGLVGETEIETNRYARAIQQEIRSFEAQTGERLTFQQAQARGLDRIVLQRLVAIAAMEDEATELGISVGDAEIREEVLRTPAFQGLDGQFDRETYEFALDNANLTVAEYEDSLRQDIARTILQGAVVSGIRPPDVFVDALYAYAREQRDLTILRLTRNDLDTPVGEPSDVDIQAFYDANPEMFTLPERKQITYAWLRPEMLLDDVAVEEDALRRLYDQRATEFNRPERRLVERLVLGDAEAARQAADAIAGGETDFDTLVEDRGLDLADIDLGEVARGDLSDAAADAVFGIDRTGVVGPAETDLGPALFRVNAILQATETPFEDVRDDLRVEYATGAARRMIEEQIEPVEDLLAGGATLEEIGDQTPFETDQTFYSPEVASVAGDDIDAYEAFRTAAEAAEPGDFPELLELADGGLVALRVDEVVPPTLQPLDEVEVAVIEAWDAAQVSERLQARGDEIVAAADDGGSLDGAGGEIVRETGVLRDAFLENTPADLVLTAFGMEEGALRVVPGKPDVLVVRVDAITPPESDTEEALQIKESVVRATGQGIAQDMTQAFTNALEAQKGIQLNSQAVQAVNAQFN